MLPKSNFRSAVLALATLVIALVIACGGDNGDAPVPGWAAYSEPAPSYLQIRAPFFAGQPIPRDEFESIGIEASIYGPAAMEPRQSFQYTLSMFQCCVVVRPVDIPVSWSVVPPEIAQVDAESGFLIIKETAPHGSMVTITAVIEGVEEPVTRELTVFSPEINPLVGRWSEGDVEGRVAELAFHSDGRYTATWFMLESYVDLLGDYTVDTTTQKIELIMDWEGEDTQGFQGRADFDIDDQDQLTLTGICPTEPDAENPDCIRRFTRSK